MESYATCRLVWKCFFQLIQKINTNKQNRENSQKQSTHPGNKTLQCFAKSFLEILGNPPTIPVDVFHSKLPSNARMQSFQSGRKPVGPSMRSIVGASVASDSCFSTHQEDTTCTVHNFCLCFTALLFSYICRSLLQHCCPSALCKKEIVKENVFLVFLMINRW